VDLMSDRLETPRLCLRPLGEADRERLHLLCAQTEVRRYLFDGRDPSRAETHTIVADSRASFAARGFGLWGLRGRSAADLVGFCGLATLPRLDAVEILYALSVDRWGAGLATEAARSVLRFGFERARLDRIVGEVDAPNQASARVLERLGMRRETEVEHEGRPLVQYAISRDELLGSRQPEM
jgi:RimJ/RimL family protein N-acetyltransferase